MKNQAATSKLAQSTCPYCGVGCGIDVKVCSPLQQTSTIPSLPNKLLSDLTGTVEHPANFGRLCIKGSHLLETTQSAGRMLHPSINGVQASWEKASSHIADKIKSLIDQHGPDSIAFYVSGQLLTEDYYVANKLMKGFIGSANIDTNSRLCMSSAVAAYKRAFGADAVPTCYADLDKTDLLVLVGSNAAWTHPVLFQRMERAKAINPALKVVQIDIRRTATSSLADLHLLLKPGSDAILFNGLLRFISKTKPNNGFIKNASSGYDRALDAALPYDIKTAAKLCELDESLLHDFYQLFVDTQKTISFYSMGINQSSSGVDKANAIINCHLATGKLGTEGSGPFSITGQPNAMGGREVGGLANMLAAHMDIENPQHREIVKQYWQSPQMVTKSGCKAVDMFGEVLSGKIKFIWIMGTNPVVSMPNRAKIEQALKVCEMVVVSDVVEQTDTLEFANVSLPATPWSEKDGTVTNSERRISRQRALVPASGEAKHDWEIMCMVAEKLGFKDAFNYAGPSDIFREHAKLSGTANNGTRAFDISGLANISDKQYEQFTPIQWPVTKDQPQGTKRLFTDRRFFTKDNKAKFIAIHPRMPEQLCTKAFPYVLNTGRTRDQWHTMTRTGNAWRLSQHTQEAVLSIHPSDGISLDLENDDLVEVRAAQGSAVILPVYLDNAQRKCDVFVPIHWSKTNSSHVAIGTLFSDANDPISGQPELKHAAVSLCKKTVAQHAHIISAQAIPNILLAEISDYWTSTKLENCTLYRIALFTENTQWMKDIQVKLGLFEITFGADLNALGNTSLAIKAKRLTLFIHINKLRLPANSQWLDHVFSLNEIEPEQLPLLLRYQPSADFIQGNIICSCHGVRLNTIKKAINEGANTVELLGEKLKCGTNCGSCKGELSTIISTTMLTSTNAITKPDAIIPITTIETN
jgi:assimilatory nitrate reductase catalytic subunit